MSNRQLLSNLSAQRLIDAYKSKQLREGSFPSALDLYQEIDSLREEVFHLALLAEREPNIREALEASTKTHPLGFHRITLYVSNNQNFRIFSNLWNRRSKGEPRKDLHDHCYDFFSVCLAGGLRHSLYELSSNGPQYFLSDSPYRGNSNERCRIGKSGEAQRLKCYDVISQGPGESLPVPCEVIHSAEPIRTPTLTIQVQGPMKKASAKVYQVRESSECFERGLPATELIEDLKQCLAKSY